MLTSHPWKPSRFIRSSQNTHTEAHWYHRDHHDILTGRSLPCQIAFQEIQKIAGFTSPFWIDTFSIALFRDIMKIPRTMLDIKPNARRVQFELQNQKRPGVGHFWKLKNDPNPSKCEFVHITDTTNPSILRHFHLCDRQFKFSSHPFLFENQVRLHALKSERRFRSNYWITQDCLQQIFRKDVHIPKHLPGMLISRSDGLNLKSETLSFHNIEEVSNPQLLEEFIRIGFHTSFHKSVRLTWDQQYAFFRAAKERGYTIPLWFKEPDLPLLREHGLFLKDNAIPTDIRTAGSCRASRVFNAEQCNDPLLLQRLVAERKCLCQTNVNYTHNKLFSYEIALKMNTIREKYRLRSKFWINEIRMQKIGFQVLPGSEGVVVAGHVKGPIMFWNLDQIVEGHLLLSSRLSEKGFLDSENPVW